MESLSTSARLAGLVQVENASPERVILAPAIAEDLGLGSILRKVSAEIPARCPPRFGSIWVFAPMKRENKKKQYVNSFFIRMRS
jgi:hypothetical protein